jgi:DNA-binding MarR family transcriptional regulator
MCRFSGGGSSALHDSDRGPAYGFHRARANVKQGRVMVVTGHERRVLAAYASAIARGDRSGVLSLADLREQTGLRPVDLDHALDSLVERGWVVSAPGVGLQRHDLCMLQSDGRRAAAEIGCSAHAGAPRPPRSDPPCSRTGANG